MFIASCQKITHPLVGFKNLYASQRIILHGGHLRCAAIPPDILC